MQQQDRTPSLLKGHPYTPAEVTDIRDTLRRFGAASVVHPFDTARFQAARMLIEMPARWHDCTPGQRKLFRDAFDKMPDAKLAIIGGDEIAEVILAGQRAYLKKLRSIAA